jgi:NTP pyrophosphatase (non-canonical NTP hydrolase)
MTQIFFTCKKCGAEFTQEDHNDCSDDGMQVAYFSHCPKCSALCESSIESQPKKYTAPIAPHEAAAKIIAHYGTAHQLVKLCEECAELTQQAAKCYDKGLAYNDDMIEEIADVIVMIKQFETIMSQPDRDLLDKIIMEKLERQLDRIEEEST